MTRQFFVTTQGQQVVIREIPAGSCAQWWTREDAWGWAQHLAKPRKVSRLQQPAKDIWFIAPDGTRTLALAKAEISKAKAKATRARRATQAPVGHTTPAPQPQRRQAARTRPTATATTPDPVLGW
jgi:hypothetical protein